MLGLVTPPAAGAAPPVQLKDVSERTSLSSHVDVLEDPTGALTLSDVVRPEIAARFRDVPGPREINFGYSRSVFWLRFTLRSAADTSRLLEVAFPSLDHVELFSPKDGDPARGYQSFATGDHLPFAQRPLPTRNFVFPLTIRNGKPATSYLRIESEGSLTVPLELWQPDAFAEYNQAAYAAIALYFGMLLALGLYNLLLFLSLREPAYFAYVGFVAAMALGQLSLAGLGNQYFWPDWPVWGNVAFPVGFAATGFFGAWFTRLFLATARISTTLDRVILAHIVLFALEAAVAPLVSYQLTAILTSLTGVSFSILAVVAGIVCLRRGQPGAPYFLLAWTLLLVGVAVMGLRNLNWLPTTFLTTHAILIGSSLEMLLLSFALASRISQLQREKVRAQNDALAASQNAERNLEQKVVERTHELAVANTQIQEALDALARVAATDSLTGTWNRRWLEKNAATEIGRAQRYHQPLSLILLDVDQFKRINDRLGHAAGDAVLIELAGVIRDQIRTSDSLTRWGGEEFVILTPSTTVEGAAHLAEKVRRAVAEHPFDRAGYVTLSLGVSELADGDRFEDFIAAADAALYRAKQGGRNRVEIARLPAERVAAAALA